MRLMCIMIFSNHPWRSRWQQIWRSKWSMRRNSRQLNYPLSEALRIWLLCLQFCNLEAHYLAMLETLTKLRKELITSPNLYINLSTWLVVHTIGKRNRIRSTKIGANSFPALKTQWLILTLVTNLWAMIARKSWRMAISLRLSNRNPRNNLLQLRLLQLNKRRRKVRTEKFRMMLQH